MLHLFLQYLWFMLTCSNTSTPSQSEIISTDVWNKIFHLTLIVMHYHVKCELVHFCEHLNCCTYLLVTKKDDVTA